MTTVNAYAAPSATEPLAPTTIERRDVGPARRPDRDQVRRHLPLRHPHRPRRLGPAALPAGPRPRDRRHRHRGRLRRDQARRRRPGRRRLHGQLLPRVRQLPGRRGAVLPRRERPAPTAPSTATAPSPRAATPPTSSSTRTSSSRIPEGIELDVAAPLLCAGITTYSPLRHWGAGPGKKVAVVGLGGLGHMAVKIAARHGRRGHRPVAVAEEAGGRPAAGRRPLLRHQRRGDLRGRSPAAST